ncbi:peptide/nickel transport system substrate-binding protein/oligopeptide transport system substrate-binding protein [Thermosporothrix hazakensis]|jgi:ABC-type oligopeptide transport system substrate-binding subunit|uniref:Peptide/nickel transport system substrate-binding protein/oligopeptide transport system substrate-binding protein n=1 Tax=Thermosporothrix hazakensis TaxID=644383 RepID=A0A326U8H1_THEHA|nr:peptide ABC transporter substrate-binding protein [Thermosporothrix hazakensis]PZW20771.1 peptide/nickel transport system substrate-binding protein/oligopeptide transport system substrate-binding protein [Thermosporothrix hazakensis]GCE50461.1 peptide ABC transporter substrate-binding protein [Thermosporothrix hazakensis]
MKGHTLERMLLTMLFLVLLLAACGGAASSSPTAQGKAPDDKQIFISPLPGASQVDTFDPARTQSIWMINPLRMIYTGLVTLDEQGSVRNQLAVSAQVSDDGLSYTFTLKDGVTFSDGAPLTSNDVVYSLDRALQPATKSPTALSTLSMIRDADQLTSGKLKTLIGNSLLTPDEKTVIIKLNRKTPSFLNALSSMCAFVLQKKVVERYGSDSFGRAEHVQQGAGIGPFRLAQYEEGVKVELVPDPRYYGEQPQLKKVLLPFYKNPGTIYKAYEAGQLSFTFVPSAQTEQAKALPQQQYHQQPQLLTRYYALNYLTKPFDNIKIRQAFALALNKTQIAEKVYKGTVQPTNHIVPQGMPDYDKETGSVPSKTGGDEQQAKKLLQEGMKEAGITSLPEITFTVATSGYPDYQNEFAAAQQMWQKVLGVTVKINNVDSSLHLKEVAASVNNPRGLQMWPAFLSLSYADPREATTAYFGKHAPGNTMNYGANFSATVKQQQDVQEMLERADVTTEIEERMRLYHTAEQRLLEDTAIIPVYQYMNVYLLKPCIQGFTANTVGLVSPETWGKVFVSNTSPCASA